MRSRTARDIESGKVDTCHLSIQDYSGGRLLLTYGYGERVKLIATVSTITHIPKGVSTTKDGLIRYLLPHHRKQIRETLQAVANGSAKQRVELDGFNLNLHPQSWSKSGTIYLPIEAAGMDMLEFMISARSARQIMAFLE